MPRAYPKQQVRVTEFICARQCGGTGLVELTPAMTGTIRSIHGDTACVDFPGQDHPCIVPIRQLHTADWHPLEHE